MSESVGPCTTINAAKLHGVTCIRGGVTFTYGAQPVSCEGIAEDQIVLVADPAGPNATLVGSSNWNKGWAVGPEETIVINIDYQVKAPVGEIGLSQIGAVVTGDGSIEATQTAGTAESTIVCDANGCPAAGKNVKFTPGTYPASLTLTMSGGKHGTAKLKELSQHVI